jgi:DNA-directed RNA polymerase subunit alpha
VSQIILNIKGLRVKLHCDCDKTVEISAVGPCKVLAGDIICDSEIEILNKEMHIATLSDGATLHMELVVKNGRGYVPAEQGKGETHIVGEIPVDAIYTPVLKVNYDVETTRVGQNIDYDKLVLSVWSDGVIHVQSAVALAARILIEHLNLFVKLSDDKTGEDIMIEKDPEITEDILAITVEELDLSVRSFNCLKRAKIDTVGDIVAKSELDMINVRNLGQKSLDEIKIKLEDLGLTLK